MMTGPYDEVILIGDRETIHLGFDEEGRPRGFFSEKQGQVYLDYVKKAPVGIVVECGVLQGRSASYILPYLKEHGYVYYAVDTFTYCQGVMLDSFKWNMEKLGFGDYVHIIKEDSITAAKHFQDDSLSAVLIDTTHDYDRTKKELTAWWPKIQVNGLIGGHDYEPKYYEGLIRAVHEVLGNPDTVQEDCWMVKKHGGDE